jgi:hypothetical protein
VQYESRSQGERGEDCVVVLWQGYVTGQFLARRADSSEPFLSSHPFRTWRPPWQPKVVLEELPAAIAAFQEIVVELRAVGWRSNGSDGFDGCVFHRAEPEPIATNVRPDSIAEPFLLRALDQVAGENGATAAEVGRALYGEDAPAVRQLPQRIGTRLRRLQLQGKVERRETDGVNRWLPTEAIEKDKATAH